MPTYLTTAAFTSLPCPSLPNVLLNSVTIQFSGYLDITGGLKTVPSAIGDLQPSLHSLFRAIQRKSCINWLSSVWNRS